MIRVRQAFILIAVLLAAFPAYAGMQIGPLTTGSSQIGGSPVAPVVTPLTCNAVLPVANGTNVSLLAGGACGYSATCAGVACTGVNAITAWAITGQSLPNAFSIITGNGILQGGSGASSVTASSYTVTVSAANSTGASPGVVQPVVVANTIPTVASHSCSINLPVTNGVPVSPSCSYSALCDSQACVSPYALTNWAITSQSVTNGFSITSAGVLQGGSGAASVVVGNPTVTVTATNSVGTSSGVTQTVTVANPAVVAPVVTALTCTITSPVMNGVNVVRTNNNGACGYSATCGSGTCTGANAITSWAITAQSTANSFAITSAGILQGGSAASSVTTGTYTVTVTATNSTGTSPGVVQTVISPGFTAVAATSPSCQGIVGCAPAGSRQVYISFSTGNDANACTIASPCKSLNYGTTQLRSGSPDQLLLLCSDTWPVSSDGFYNGGGHLMTTLNGLTPSGAIGTTITGPILISSYGTCSGGRRPQVQVGLASSQATASAFFWFCCSTGTANNVAIIGLDFYAPAADPTASTYTYAGAIAGCTAVQFLSGTTSWFLFEDNRTQYCEMNIQSANTNPTNGPWYFRRNIGVGTYSLGGGNNTSLGGHSSWMFIIYANQRTWDSNYLAFNGWNPILQAPQTVSINTSTGTITWPISGYAFNALPFGNGATVSFENTSGGVSSSTYYCVINANASAGTFQIAVTGNTGTVCTSSTPIAISTASNVMRWEDPVNVIFNHQIYDDQLPNNSSNSTGTNNILAWGNGYMDRAGGVRTGNFVTYNSNSINVGAFLNCCGGGEGAVTSWTATGNVVQHSGWFYGPFQYTAPGDGSSTAAPFAISHATGTSNSVLLENNLISQSGNSACVVYSNGGSGNDVFTTVNINNICYIAGQFADQDTDTGNGNTLTPQTCTDLTGANSGCADEPFPNPLRDILTYDHDTFGTTCSGTGYSNTCWVDFHNRQLTRAPGTWPTNLAAPAINSYMLAGFGLTCPTGSWC